MLLKVAQSRAALVTKNVAKKAPHSLKGRRSYRTKDTYRPERAVTRTEMKEAQPAPAPSVFSTAYWTKALRDWKTWHLGDTTQLRAPNEPWYHYIFCRVDRRLYWEARTCPLPTEEEWNDWFEDNDYVCHKHLRPGSENPFDIKEYLERPERIEEKRFFWYQVTRHVLSDKNWLTEEDNYMRDLEEKINTKEVRAKFIDVMRGITKGMDLPKSLSEEEIEDMAVIDEEGAEREERKQHIRDNEELVIMLRAVEQKLEENEDAVKTRHALHLIDSANKRETALSKLREDVQERERKRVEIFAGLRSDVKIRTPTPVSDEDLKKLEASGDTEALAKARKDNLRFKYWGKPFIMPDLTAESNPEEVIKNMEQAELYTEENIEKLKKAMYNTVATLKLKTTAPEELIKEPYYADWTEKQKKKQVKIWELKKEYQEATEEARKQVEEADAFEKQLEKSIHPIRSFLAEFNHMQNRRFEKLQKLFALTRSQSAHDDVARAKISRLFDSMLSVNVLPEDRDTFLMEYDLSYGEKEIEILHTLPAPVETYEEMPIVKDFEEPDDWEDADDHPHQ